MIAAPKVKSDDSRLLQEHYYSSAGCRGYMEDGPSEAQWFAESRMDLDSARVLFDAQLYPRALFSLQQANEKLAKGLLIKTGILTPKRIAKDWQTKQLIGFLPKEPREYGHRIVQSLLADADMSVPFLDQLLKLVEPGKFRPQVSSMRKRIKANRKGVRLLKKRPFRLVSTGQQLDREIEDANMLLDRIGLAVSAMKDKLRDLDQDKVSLAAVKNVKRLGLKVRPADVPPVQPIADEVISTIRLTFLTVLAVSVTAILDPLEAVTRYPGKGRQFDEADPYVERFPRLRALVERMLGMAGT